MQLDNNAFYSETERNIGNILEERVNFHKKKKEKIIIIFNTLKIEANLLFVQYTIKKK